MEIAIIIALILLNGVLSMSEIALASARKSKLESETKHGSVAAKTALRLSNDPDRFLSTTQIGITLISILNGLYSGEAFAGDLAELIAKSAWLAPYSLGISKTIIVILVTYLTLVFGELAPKRLGLMRPERVSKIVARPMYLLSRLVSPAVWLLSKSTSGVVKLLGIKENDARNNITEDEIKAIVKEGVDSGEVQEVEHDIVERVFSLGDRDVESIMTHRSDLVWLDTDDDRETIRAKVMPDMHNVYPVGDNGTFKGAVLLQALFAQIDSPDFTLAKVISTGYFMPESQSVYTALARFKQNNVKYGFVIDEFGEVEGIVTLKDILEALVGQVDDIEEEKEIVQRADGSYLVDGQCSFYNFLEYFDLEELYTDNDHNTLSGLLLEELKRIPVTGDIVAWHDFRFEIVDMDGARIDKVLVNYTPQTEIDN